MQRRERGSGVPGPSRRRVATRSSTVTDRGVARRGAPVQGRHDARLDAMAFSKRRS